jgi:hypothetical protein
MLKKEGGKISLLFLFAVFAFTVAVFAFLFFFKSKQMLNHR